jgi:hypothetical protein
MSVRSFSSVTKDFASARSQSHIQVFATHSRLRPLILRVFLFGSSWIFGRGFTGCRLDRKSTSGTCQFLSSSFASWSSHKQSSVAQSTTETEYVSTASCFSQLLWTTYTMSDFCEKYTHVLLLCDNTSAINIAQNPVLHSKTKHIEVRYHFLRDNVEKGKITLIRVPTHDQLADIFTQAPRSSNFHSFARGTWCVFDFLSWVWGLLCSICIAFLCTCLHLHGIL